MLANRFYVHEILLGCIIFHFTGHVLDNGTFVGTTGDVYNGEADIGLMVATTYFRFPFIEFCATINFAYMGFVIGNLHKQNLRLFLLLHYFRSILNLYHTRRTTHKVIPMECYFATL